MKYFFSLFWAVIVVLIGGCYPFAVQPPPNIRVSVPVPVVKEGGRLVKDQEAIPSGLYYPDPTLGVIENNAQNTSIDIWLNPFFEGGSPKGKPDINLPPRAAIRANLPFGEHIVYAKGWVQTDWYDWQPVGSAREEVLVDGAIQSGWHYGWRVRFHESDFRLR